MRLIDADALLNRIEVEPLTFDGGVDINDLEKIIKTQPTIEQKHGVLVAKKDVIETLKTTLADGILLDTLELRINDIPSAQPKIVRCKECKHDAYVARCEDVMCMKTGAFMKKNDFCSYGEREGE